MFDKFIDTNKNDSILIDLINNIDIEEKMKKEIRRARRRVDANNFYVRNRIQRNTQNINRSFQLKLQVIQILGGRCITCGYNEHFAALHVDHINGDGAERRRNIYGCSKSVYRDIRKNGPQGIYQLLCANCNYIKRYENKEYGSGKPYKNKGNNNHAV